MTTDGLKPKKAIRSLMDLEVAGLAKQLAQTIFELTKKFPREEKYSLTDQIRRSSRSVAANIAEGWGKRVYPDLFRRHLIDANGSVEETKAWLMIAHECRYLNETEYKETSNQVDEIGAKLYRLHQKWESYD